MEFVILADMIPKDHLLRKIDSSVDFSFIRGLCEPLGCPDNGCTTIDPETLFRMLFLGYLYGIRSEQRLEEEVSYNLAYKWFCGLDIRQMAPDAATLSVNRKQCFRDSDIPEQVLGEILRQAIAKKLVGSNILRTDSAHVKAKTNKQNRKAMTVERTPKAYLAELDQAITQDRAAQGMKQLARDEDDDPPTADIQ